MHARNPDLRLFATMIFHLSASAAIKTLCYSSVLHAQPRRQHLLLATRQVCEGIGCYRSATPVRAPKANAICERFGGTLRRECLDFVIPLNERHLKMTVQQWGNHYNRGRPHSTLGPGLPE